MKLLFKILPVLLFTNVVAQKSIFSLNSALDYYGFTTLKQKKALQGLLQEASILSKGKTLNEVFPVRKTSAEVVSDIVVLIKETQNKFVIRSGTQERWEVKSPPWMEKNAKNIILNLKTLGFVDATSPQKRKIGALCILGASRPTMKKRINYTDSLIKEGLQTKIIILLTGERYLTKDVDGSEDKLREIARKFHLKDWKQLTETHIARHLYGESDAYRRKIDHHIIDTPKGDLPRPTTQTTLLELIKWLKSHKKIKNILFISNQPHVKYQKSIIDLLFKEHSMNIHYAVVGNGVETSETPQSILGALGSYIWAAFPLILSKMDAHIADKKIKEDLQKLYGTNPLMKEITRYFTP